MLTPEFPAPAAAPAYEYKFVRIEVEQGWLGREAERDYREVIQRHGREGWRLVQIFSPLRLGADSSMVPYFELIFERPASLALSGAPGPGAEEGWFYRTDEGLTAGPFTEDELADAFRGEGLSPRTHVRRPGSAEWIPASFFPSLMDRIARGGGG